MMPRRLARSIGSIIPSRRRSSPASATAGSHLLLDPALLTCEEVLDQVPRAGGGGKSERARSGAAGAKEEPGDSLPVLMPRLTWRQGDERSLHRLPHHSRRERKRRRSGGREGGGWAGGVKQHNLVRQAVGAALTL
eukprot:222296-Hanusia_phi.AAC.1